MTRRVSARWLFLAVVLTVIVLGQVPSVGASNWSVVLETGSRGEAESMTASPPASVAASCVSPSGYTIDISWSAVTHASSYTVYQSKTTSSSPGTYTSAKTGVTGTSWTTGTLATGYNYWYEVVSVYSTPWTSAKSTASGETTISSSSPECKQP
jgi:hypothetical protein